MKTFAQVDEDLDLLLWGIGKLSRLYVPRRREERFSGENLLIHHFDTDRTNGLVGAYAEVIAALQNWVDDHRGSEQFVKVNSVEEVGLDYIARKFIIYMYSLESWDDPEPHDLTEVIPEGMAPMREYVRLQLEESTATGRTAIVEQVLADSLLGPSPSTTEGGGDSFLIVSPVVSIEQLEEWVATPEH